MPSVQQEHHLISEFNRNLNHYSLIEVETNKQSITMDESPKTVNYKFIDIQNEFYIL